MREECRAGDVVCVERGCRVVSASTITLNCLRSSGACVGPLQGIVEFVNFQLFVRTTFDSMSVQKKLQFVQDQTRPGTVHKSLPADLVGVPP